MTSRPAPPARAGGCAEALSVTITGLNIDQVSHFSITNALLWIEQLAGLALSADNPGEAANEPAGPRTATAASRRPGAAC